ncbi:MAG: DUF2934 domain-containing protein [Nitrospirota bacterium]
MARQRTKPTPEIDGRQGRTLAPTNAPTRDNKNRQTLPHKNGNDAATNDNRARIEKLAYELYQQRGRQDGYDRQDWLEAERLILSPSAHTRQDSSDRLPTSVQA